MGRVGEYLEKNEKRKSHIIVGDFVKVNPSIRKRNDQPGTGEVVSVEIRNGIRIFNIYWEKRDVFWGYRKDLLIKDDTKVRKLHKKTIPVIVKLWRDSKMAEVWYNKELQFCGNFWDFHAGCHGNVWRVNGKDHVLSFYGWHSFAGAFSAAVGSTKIIVKDYKGKWPN